MLANHVMTVVNASSHLQHVLGVRQLDHSTSLIRLTERADAGILSSGERALALCLLDLLEAPDLPDSFGECFDRLDRRGRTVILTILSSYDAAVSEREQAGLDMLRRSGLATEE